MAKFYCPNEQCKDFNKPKDIDMSITAYYLDFQGENFNMKSKKLLCKECDAELEFKDDSKKLTHISSNYSRMTHDEKMNVLKARSRDMKIQANREIRDRKEFLDKTI